MQRYTEDTGKTPGRDVVRSVYQSTGKQPLHFQLPLHLHWLLQHKTSRLLRRSLLLFQLRWNLRPPEQEPGPWHLLHLLHLLHANKNKHGTNGCYMIKKCIKNVSFALQINNLKGKQRWLMKYLNVLPAPTATAVTETKDKSNILLQLTAELFWFLYVLYTWYSPGSISFCVLTALAWVWLYSRCEVVGGASWETKQRQKLNRRGRQRVTSASVALIFRISKHRVTWNPSVRQR